MLPLLYPISNLSIPITNRIGIIFHQLPSNKSGNDVSQISSYPLIISAEKFPIVI